MKPSAGWNSCVPASAIPREHAFEERDSSGRELLKQAFALLRRGGARVADVSWRRAVLRGPPAEGRLERVSGLSRGDVGEVADEVRCDAQNHRCFPFTGMGHL